MVKFYEELIFKDKFRIIHANVFIESPKLLFEILKMIDFSKNILIKEK